MFFENVLPLAPRECDAESLLLLVKWFSWRDAPARVILVHALEANPRIVLLLCRFNRLYRLLTQASREAL